MVLAREKERTKYSFFAFSPRICGVAFRDSVQMALGSFLWFHEFLAVCYFFFVCLEFPPLWRKKNLPRLENWHRFGLGGRKQIAGAGAQQRRELRRNGRVVRRDGRLTVNRGWRAQMRVVRRRARVVVVDVMPVAVVTDVGGGEVMQRGFAQRRPAAVVVVADLLQGAAAGRCGRRCRRQHVEMRPLRRRFAS